MGIEANFMVGGEASQGVQSAGFLLAKAFARWGYHRFYSDGINQISAFMNMNW